MHLLLLCLGVFACQYYCMPNQNGFTDPLWIEFKLKFGRFYNSETEEAKRYAIFQEHLKDINKHNNNPAHKYKKGINHFSDLVSFLWISFLYHVDIRCKLNIQRMFRRSLGLLLKVLRTLDLRPVSREYNDALRLQLPHL